MDTDMTPPLKTMNRRDVLSYFEHSKQHDTPSQDGVAVGALLSGYSGRHRGGAGSQCPRGRTLPFWVILSDIMLALREWSEEQPKFGDGKVQAGDRLLPGRDEPQGSRGRHRRLEGPTDPGRASIYADLMRQDLLLMSSSAAS